MQLSTCIFPRVTDILPVPVPLPLHDIISQLLTVKLNENVSHKKGEGTIEKVSVIGWKMGRSPFFLQIWLEAGRDMNRTQLAFRSPEARGCNIPSGPKDPCSWGEGEEEFCQKEGQEVEEEGGQEDRGGQGRRGRGGGVRKEVGLLHFLCKPNWWFIHS